MENQNDKILASLRAVDVMQAEGQDTILMLGEQNAQIRDIRNKVRERLDRVSVAPHLLHISISFSPDIVIIFPFPIFHDFICRQTTLTHRWITPRRS
jgi:hypothetical protein